MSYISYLVCWHFAVDILVYFPFHLMGRGGNWGALFKQNMLSFLASLDCWVQQIYLSAFYLFSKFLCCTPNAVTTKCWKYAKLISEFITSLAQQLLYSSIYLVYKLLRKLGFMPSSISILPVWVLVFYWFGNVTEIGVKRTLEQFDDIEYSV